MGRIFLQSMMGAGVVHIYEVWAPYPCKTVFFLKLKTTMKNEKQ